LNTVSPVVQSEKVGRVGAIADYGGKHLWKRWVWAWSEIMHAWWRVRVMSRWRMNYRVWHY